jgi:hypothetical protein
VTASRFSAWGGIAFFVVPAIFGLFLVKWSPYYATGFHAAQDHTIGASIVSGKLPAPPEVSFRAGLDYSIAYMKAAWQALLLGLALDVGVETLLPRVPLTRLFSGSKGPAACHRVRHSLDDVHISPRPERSSSSRLRAKCPSSRCCSNSASAARATAALLITLPAVSLPSLAMLARTLPIRAVLVLAFGTFAFGLIAAAARRPLSDFRGGASASMMA